MGGRGPARPHAFEERYDGRRPAGKLADDLAIAAMNRQRTRDPLPRKMLHQAEKERQVRLLHPLLVEREDERPTASMQDEVRILGALGDALVGQQFANVVAAQERAEFGLGDVGIDGHGFRRSR